MPLSPFAFLFSPRYCCFFFLRVLRRLPLCGAPLATCWQDRYRLRLFAREASFRDSIMVHHVRVTDVGYHGRRMSGRPPVARYILPSRFFVCCSRPGGAGYRTLHRGMPLARPRKAASTLVQSRLSILVIPRGLESTLLSRSSAEESLLYARLLLRKPR